MESRSTDIEILKQNLKPWQGLTSTEIRFERLAGLSNAVWKVTALSDTVSPKSVVYRKFYHDSALVDRTVENYISSELAKKKLGPDYYGCSSEFRIEEYCESNPVTPSSTRIKDVRRNIAKKLAALHATRISKLDEKPLIRKQLEEEFYFKEIEKKLATTEFDDRELRIMDEIQKIFFAKGETEFLLSILPDYPESVTFSHNDLHAGNILQLKDTNDYLFIDFEFTSNNYRGFDIATLYLGTMIDYTYREPPYYKINEELFAPSSEIEDFVKYYTFFSSFAKEMNDDDAASILGDAAVLEEYLTNSGQISKFSCLVDQIMHEVSINILLSNYYWGIWSVLFCKNRESKFDYVLYAYDRAKMYEKSKAELLAKNVKSVN